MRIRKPSRDLIVLAVMLALAWGGMQLLRRHADAEDGEQLRALAKPGDVLMLGSVTCTFCAQARSWLEEEKVPYRECLIERDADCLREYQARGGFGTPTFVVRGHTVVGFDRQAIAKLLAH